MALIPRIRGWIANAIPADIIQNICEELERELQEEAWPGLSSTPSIALQKHSKNRDIRAISHVCKSWRFHTTTLMCLWRDIAFDVAEPETIRLAANFLSLVEGQDVSLRIYAGFGHSDLPGPDGLGNLLSGLRRNTHQWAVFECQGALGRYHSYFDLPAPNLRYFSDHGQSSWDVSQPFHGCTPSLRYLLTSSTTRWGSIPLSNLTEFHFEQPTCGPSPSLKSLLDFLQNALGLETLRLKWLGSFIHDCAADATVSLLRLHAIQVHNTDFEALTEHIFIPNVRRAALTVDTPTSPLFEAPHALTSLSSIPILDQPVSEVVVVIAHTMNGGNFRIRLMMDGEGSFDMSLIWDAGVIQDWKSYVADTLSALTERIWLDPGAVLRLYLGIGHRRSSPGALKVHGGFARGIFQALVDAETPAVIYPPIASHLLIASDERAVDEDETQIFRLCLGSRATCEVGLFVRLRHGSSPWLCAADFECPDECKYILQVLALLFLILFVGGGPHHFLEFEFHPLEDDLTHDRPSPSSFQA